MPVFIHADFLDALTSPDPVVNERVTRLGEQFAYEQLVTTEGMISEFLRRWAGRGPLPRDRAVEMARTFYLRRGTVRSVDFARFVTALDAYRNEFRDSTLSLEDVTAVLLMRETDSVDILSANAEFQSYGLRPLMA